MPSERALEIAKQILEDLRGNAYYADPQVLAGFFSRGESTRAEDEAKFILSSLLKRYAVKCAGDSEEVNYLASLLDGKVN
jgi:hypothetical protein